MEAINHLVFLILMGSITALSNICPTFKTALENEVLCTKHCIEMRQSHVWGTIEYSEDSSVCRSAVHAGVLSHDGGSVRFKHVNEHVQQFIASVRNRVISQPRSRVGEGYLFITESAITTEEVGFSDEMMIVHNSYNLQEDDSNYLHLCCISSSRDIQEEDLVNWKYEQLGDITISKGSNTLNRGCIVNELSIDNRRAVRCLGSTPQYDVTAVIQAPHSLNHAPSSSITANMGDNLTIIVEEQSPDSTGNQDTYNIFWRRLPMPWSYNSDELASQHSSIYIESAEPGDSGIYIAGNSKENSVWSQSKEYVETKGAYFRIIVRDCHQDHWALTCMQQCPECHHGGQCHPNTGVCICPPGYFGTFCQHACDEGKFGSDCNFSCEENTLGFSADKTCKGLTFCLPDPYGCSCSPGFTGSLCNQVCSSKQYGPNCALICDYCTGDCDDITGICFDSCCEDIACIDNLPLMLPYLAQLPNLSNISSNAAALSFASWRNHSDGGLQQTSILSYLVQMRKHHLDPWVEEAGRPDGGTVILAELFPGQEYHVRVVISTAAGMEQGDTSQRRVKEAMFTTSCLEEARTSPVASNISQSSVTLSWLPVEENQQFCNTQYKVDIIDALDGSSVEEETTVDTSIDVTLLLPDHEYIAFLSVLNILDAEPTSSNVSFISISLAPGPPILTFIQKENNQFILAWNLPPNSSPADHYDVNYKIISYGGCNDTLHSSTLYQMNINETRLVFSDLEPYSNYIFCVGASNKGGDGPMVCQENYTAPIRGPTLDIEDFQCIPDNSNKAQCSARIVGPCQDVNGPQLTAHLRIQGYVNCTAELISTQVVLKFKNMILDFLTETFLKPGIKYIAKLSLSNEFDEGTSSISHFMTNAGKPPPVNNPRAISVSSVGAVLQWGAPCPDHGGIIRYYINGKPVSYGMKCENTTENTYCYEVKGIKPGMQYRFKIEAENQAGKSDASFISFETDLEYPSAPVSIKTNKGLKWLDISIVFPDRLGGPLITCSIKVIEQNSTCRADISYRDVAAGYVTCNISGLDAGKKYLTTAICCNAKGCGDELNTMLATLPSKPKVMGNIGLLESKSSSIRIHLPYIETKRDEKSYVAVIVQDISNGEDNTKSKLSGIYNKIRHAKEKSRNSFSKTYDDKNNEISTTTTSNGSNEIKAGDGHIDEDIFKSSNEERISSANDLENEGFIFVNQISDNHRKLDEKKKDSNSFFINDFVGSGESYLDAYTGNGFSYAGSGEIPYLVPDVYVNEIDRELEENVKKSESDGSPFNVTEVSTSFMEIMQLHENTSTVAFSPDKVQTDDESTEEKYVSECNKYIYIAGILFKSHEEFIVGDGKSYGGYQNCPLQPGHTYKVGFVAVTSLHGEEQYSEQTLGSAILAADEEVWQKLLSDIKYGLRTLGSLFIEALQSPIGVICFIVAVFLGLFGFIIPALFCWGCIAAPVFFMNKTDWNPPKHSRELGDGTSMDTLPCEDIPMVEIKQLKE